MTTSYNAHAFECLRCDHEWRTRTTDQGWPLGECPECGHHYWDWLSFEVAPRDVYLNREVLAGRPLPGTSNLRRRKSGS